MNPIIINDKSRNIAVSLTLSRGYTSAAWLRARKKSGYSPCTGIPSMIAIRCCTQLAKSILIFRLVKSESNLIQSYAQIGTIQVKMEILKNLRFPEPHYKQVCLELWVICTRHGPSMHKHDHICRFDLTFSLFTKLFQRTWGSSWSSSLSPPSPSP